LFYILDFFKLKDYEGYEKNNYEIEINNKINMKINETDNIKEFIEYIKNEKGIISIKIVREADDIECLISFDSPDYEIGYLENKNTHNV